jgi:hypothetical protein
MINDLAYDLVMANSDSQFEVTCPCCNAVLRVDAESKAVIAHTAAVKPKMFADIEEFQEAVRKAKESPDTGKPIRDFDLD